MHSHLLFLAEAAGSAAAAHGDGASAISKITETFGISWPFILAQMLNFTLVAFLLWKFAFKPVLATLDERQRKIASGLEYADEMKAKLEAVQQESIATAKKSQVEATRIIEEARKQAKEFLDKQTQESAAKANDILAKAQEVIELEKRKMLADARGEIAKLVVEITERVLSKQLSDADRSRYNDAAARELTQV
jgi:F-type H+-transporting ATPase subunit b